MGGKERPEKAGKMTAPRGGYRRAGQGRWAGPFSDFSAAVQSESVGKVLVGDSEPTLPVRSPGAEAEAWM